MYFIKLSTLKENIEFPNKPKKILSKFGKKWAIIFRVLLFWENGPWLENAKISFLTNSQLGIKYKNVKLSIFSAF